MNSKIKLQTGRSRYRRAATRENHPPTPANKLHYEGCASRCDAVVDPLLAQEVAEAAATRAAAEAEAAPARAAAEIKAAKARGVAEAKATAAAEELLAGEEKEKQRAVADGKAGKANQKAKGRGKKGQGSGKR